MQCGRCARAIKRILNEALADCAAAAPVAQPIAPVIDPSTTSRDCTAAFLLPIDACRIIKSTPQEPSRGLAMKPHVEAIHSCEPARVTP
jgi:hypothetical protein